MTRDVPNAACPRTFAIWAGALALSLDRPKRGSWHRMPRYELHCTCGALEPGVALHLRVEAITSESEPTRRLHGNAQIRTTEEGCPRRVVQASPERALVCTKRRRKGRRTRSRWSAPYSKLIDLTKTPESIQEDVNKSLAFQPLYIKRLNEDKDLLNQLTCLKLK